MSDDDVDIVCPFCNRNVLYDHKGEDCDDFGTDFCEHTVFAHCWGYDHMDTHLESGDVALDSTIQRALDDECGGDPEGLLETVQEAIENFLPPGSYETHTSRQYAERGAGPNGGGPTYSVVFLKRTSPTEGEAVSADWYRKAAEHGEAEAQYSLAVRCAEGRGVVKDDAIAVNWYRKAAEQGFAAAQHALGICYATGHGVPTDEAAASEWYNKAAEQGYPESLLDDDDSEMPPHVSQAMAAAKTLDELRKSLKGVPYCLVLDFPVFSKRHLIAISCMDKDQCPQELAPGTAFVVSYDDDSVLLYNEDDGYYDRDRSDYESYLCGVTCPFCRAFNDGEDNTCTHLVALEASYHDRIMYYDQTFGRAVAKLTVVEDGSEEECEDENGTVIEDKTVAAMKRHFAEVKVITYISSTPHGDGGFHQRYIFHPDMGSLPLRQEK